MQAIRYWKIRRTVRTSAAIRGRTSPLDIYITVTKELKLREFGNFSEKMAQQRAELDKRNAASAEDSE